MPLEITVFVSILLFLLSIPIGVITNGTSYFLLGWIQYYFIHLCIEENTAIGQLAEFTKKRYNYKKIFNEFGINNVDDFYQKSQIYETSMSVTYTDIFKLYSYIIGCSRLLRNFALIDIGVFGYLTIANGPKDFSLLVTLSFLISPLIIIYISKSADLKISVLMVVIICVLVSLCCNKLSLPFFQITIPLSLFIYYIISFFFFISISSLLEFYYYINILLVTSLLHDKEKCNNKQ